MRYVRFVCEKASLFIKECGAELTSIYLNLGYTMINLSLLLAQLSFSHISSVSSRHRNSTKLSSQHLLLGHHLNGVLLAGRRWPTFSGIWIIPPLINLKKTVVDPL